MTDEERQKLVANLYSLSRDDDRATLCYDAADEIERLSDITDNRIEFFFNAMQRCNCRECIRAALKQMRSY